jgi:hypothetical protein
MTFDHDVTIFAVSSNRARCDENGSGLSLNEVAHVEVFSGGLSTQTIAARSASEIEVGAQLQAQNIPYIRASCKCLPQDSSLAEMAAHAVL